MFARTIEMAWPWMGLGGAIVMLAVMFLTDSMRGRVDTSRWRDPVWLAWLTIPLYLLHQFEEYPLYYDLQNHSYLIIESVCKAQGYASTAQCTLPMAHFPLVNIAFAWFAAPLAAWLGRHNPVIGLTFYGLIIFNGILHLATSIVSGKLLPGVVTGTLLFVPVSIWVVYVCRKFGVMSGKALTISFSGGIIGHLVLFAAYASYSIGGAPLMYALDLVAVIGPIVIAAVGSKFLSLNVDTSNRV